MEPQECQLSGGYGATVLIGLPALPGHVEYGERSRITCDTCSALGWLPASGGTSPCGTPLDWPVPCDVCDGKGSFSLHAIAEVIDEDPGVLYRLSEQRVRAKTALRLLDKLLMFNTKQESRPSLAEGWQPQNKGDVGLIPA